VSVRAIRRKRTRCLHLWLAAFRQTAISVCSGIVVQHTVNVDRRCASSRQPLFPRASNFCRRLCVSFGFSAPNHCGTSALAVCFSPARFVNRKINSIKKRIKRREQRPHAVLYASVTPAFYSLTRKFPADVSTSAKIKANKYRRRHCFPYLQYTEDRTSVRY